MDDAPQVERSILAAPEGVLDVEARLHSGRGLLRRLPVRFRLGRRLALKYGRCQGRLLGAGGRGVALTSWSK